MEAIKPSIESFLHSFPFLFALNKKKKKLTTYKGQQNLGIDKVVALEHERRHVNMFGCR